MDVRTLMRRSAGSTPTRRPSSTATPPHLHPGVGNEGSGWPTACWHWAWSPATASGVLGTTCLSAADAYLGLTAATWYGCRSIPATAGGPRPHAGPHRLQGGDDHRPLRRHGAGLDAELPALDTWWCATTATKLAGGPGPDRPRPPVSESDWYIIRHTAGTTGKSKGVPTPTRRGSTPGRDWFYDWPPVERATRRST